MLSEHPKFFENFFNLLLVCHRKYFLRRNLSVMQFNPAIAKARYSALPKFNYEAPLTFLVWLTSVLSIAQFGSTRSINAGVASGIAMHTWIRQHA